MTARRALNQVRVRVTLAATLAALGVGILGSVLFMTTLRGAMDRQLLSSGEATVQSVQAQLGQGEKPARAVAAGKNDTVIQIVDGQGKVLATDRPRITSPLRTRPGTAKGVRVEGLKDRYVVVARTASTSVGLIVVGQSSEQVDEATRTAELLLLVSVPMALAVLAVTVWLSVARALRPVEAMRQEAAAITATRLHRRLAVPEGDDEIRRLGRTLNEMLDRMDAASGSLRQFVSDASHELRSPLAALRQLAEVARRYPDRVSPSSLARDVLLEEGRMENMVTSLLLLARLDDAVPPPGTEVDLDDVLLEQVRLLGHDAAPRIDASGVSAGQVFGDRVLLDRLVANLLGNALRHACSEVRVTLHEYDDVVLLTVDDDGPGIPEPERQRVFERFVRLDDARTADQGGSGLGLAIVRKVVQDAGGTVRVGDSETGGARFVVALPASNS